MTPNGGQTRALSAATAGPLALRDGSVVCIRPIRPDDAPQLIAFFAGLSRETLMRRFFRRVPPLSPEQSTALARVDYAGSMALVAAAGPEPDAAILAVARYDRVGAEEAELGFVVADTWQGRGIGTALFHRLAPYARAHGITTFVAVTMTNNARVLRLLRRCGYPCAARIASVEVELRLDISAAPGPGRPRTL
jgi:RimJ/RimL family protein N-acetyltransferase